MYKINEMEIKLSEGRRLRLDLALHVPQKGTFALQLKWIFNVLFVYFIRKGYNSAETGVINCISLAYFDIETGQTA